MKIKIKKLHPDAKIPIYANNTDAGMDVWATSKEEKEKYIEYGTGLSFEVPAEHVMLIFPRSSLTNKDLILGNHVGVLDAGYRGELKFRFKKTGKDVYEAGERIGQIMILPFPKIEFEEAEILAESERGKNGFGSTGK
jgi:dUTP pyrophosphatase